MQPKIYSVLPTGETVIDNFNHAKYMPQAILLTGPQAGPLRFASPDVFKGEKVTMEMVTYRAGARAACIHATRFRCRGCKGLGFGPRARTISSAERGRARFCFCQPGHCGCTA